MTGAGRRLRLKGWSRVLLRPRNGSPIVSEFLTSASMMPAVRMTLWLWLLLAGLLSAAAPPSATPCPRPGVGVVAAHPGSSFPTVWEATAKTGSPFPTVWEALAKTGSPFPTVWEATAKTGSPFPIVWEATAKTGSAFLNETLEVSIISIYEVARFLRGS